MAEEVSVKVALPAAGKTAAEEKTVVAGAALKVTLAKESKRVTLSAGLAALANSTSTVVALAVASGAQITAPAMAITAQ